MMRMLFFDNINWDYDVSTPDVRPLGGSQSAMCYLVEELAQRGHEVTLMTNTSRPGWVRGVNCVSFQRIPAGLLPQPWDACIVLNGPADLCLQMRPYLSKSTPLVLWTQHAHDQPAMHPFQRAEVREGWDEVVCVSDWHRQMMQATYGLDPARMCVLRNAISPKFEQLFSSRDELVQTKGTRPILAYTSTPFRGLDVLVKVFRELQPEFPEALLRVYSSMQVYQQPAEQDQYRALYEACRSTPGIEYVGSLPQSELAVALREATIHAYPNTFAETACIAVMEALAAGLCVVTSELGALPETTLGWGRLVQPARVQSELPRFVADYTQTLREVLRQHQQDPEGFVSRQWKQVEEMQSKGTWKVRATEWEAQVPQWTCRPRGAATAAVPTTASQAARPAAVGSATAGTGAPATAAVAGRAASSGGVSAGLGVAPSGGGAQQGGPITGGPIAGGPVTGGPGAGGPGAGGAGGAGAGAAGSVLELNLQTAQGPVKKRLTITESIQLAREWMQGGQAANAETICRALLQLAPQQAEPHRLLGLVAYSRGEFDQALNFLRQAVTLDPQLAEAWDNLCAVQGTRGDFAAAEQAVRKALSIRPRFAEAESNLGSLLKAMGRLEEAVSAYERALLIRPLFAEAEFNLGNVLHQLGRREEAVRAYRRALVIRPQYVDALQNLGTVCRELGDTEQALGTFNQVLAIKADVPEALYSRGCLLNSLGRSEEAIDDFRRALAVRPQFPEAENALGNALQSLRYLEDALQAYRRAIALRPQYPEAENNQGTILQYLGEFEAASQCYQRALAIRPQFPEAENNLGTSLQSQGRIAEAREAYLRALALRPTLADAHSNLFANYQCQPGMNWETLYHAHREWDALHAAKFREEWKPFDLSRDPARKLRVAFLSSDFGFHPVGFFLAGFLEHLDKNAFEIVCYSDRSGADDLTHRIRRAAAEWHETRGLPAATVAERIRADRIDVLFDLSGHTSGHRLMVFARKPAPVQITWIGYVGTTGMQAMDWILGDAYQLPAGVEPFLVERPLRLPRDYICYTPPENAPEVGPLPALARGQVTFGCCNNLAKLNPQVIATWCEILKQVPESRLLLRYKGLNDEGTCERFRRQFEEQGIGRDRLDLGSRSPFLEVLKDYNHIDLALDPFPYSGGLTTCEALWMGVPVVTFPGETFASRHSYSHLMNAGVTETLATSREESIAKAVEWARDLERLAELRRGLRERVASSALCDAKTFAHDWSQAIRQAWGQWCQA